MADRIDDEEEKRERDALNLTHEIAEKYDPAFLARTMSKFAGSKRKLDRHTQSKMERHISQFRERSHAVDFSGVELIQGTFAEEITRRYRADAITVGGTKQILVREGWQSNLESIEGQTLLAHELTHIDQMHRGMRLSGDGSDHSHPQEEEAQRSGQRFKDTETGESDAARKKQQAQRAALMQEVKLAVLARLLRDNQMGRDRSRG